MAMFVIKYSHIQINGQVYGPINYKYTLVHFELVCKYFNHLINNNGEL